LEALSFEGPPGTTDHLVLLVGDMGDGRDVLVRVHSECLTGDVFGSSRCDCGTQLDAGLDAIVEEGRGMLIYLLGHEGRGVGLLRKLQAYDLQEQGLDTVDANLSLGLPVDARQYATVAAVLSILGVQSIRLLTNNPAKVVHLEASGVTVTGRVRLPVVATPDNVGYLVTKRDRMGHDLPGLPTAVPSPSA
jgi:3,4-dihydroxy 2-butanone 4-phosphate synthase/GTP cyclohydrolase II